MGMEGTMRLSMTAVWRDELNRLALVGVARLDVDAPLD